MAFALSERAPVFGTNTDASTFQTASYTFAAGAKVLVVVFNPGTPAPAVPGFSQIISQQNGNSNRRITVFESDATPANGPITVNFSVVVESCNIWVGQVPDGFGSPVIRQVRSGAFYGPEPFTFAPDGEALSSSIMMAATVGAALNDYTFATPYVEQSQMTTGTPPMASRVAIAPSDAQAVTVTATGGNIPHAIVLVELQAQASLPTAVLAPATQQQAAGGTFTWDASGSTGNALSFALTVVDAGTTGATNADIAGGTSNAPTLDATGFTPGTGTVQLTVTDAASQTATATAEFTVTNTEATLVPYLWDATNQVWVRMTGTGLWDGTSWDGTSWEVQAVQRGVNLMAALEAGAGGNQGLGSGGTFSNQNVGVHGTDYRTPPAGDFTYLAGRGLNAVRLAFRWERLQPVLGGPLDAAQVGYIETAIDRAAATGIKVFPTLTNYGAYWNYENGVGVRRSIGADDGVVTGAHLVDLWEKLVSALQPRKASIAAWAIMGEPFLADSVGDYTAGATLHTFDATTESFTAADGSTLTRDTAIARNGGGSLKVAAARSGTGFGGTLVYSAPRTTKDIAANGLTIEQWVYVPVGNPGGDQARIDIQNSAFEWIEGAPTTLTEGQWTAVRHTFTAAQMADVQRVTVILISNPSVDGSQPVYYVDDITQGTISGAVSAEEKWETISGDVFDAITAIDPTTPVAIPLHGFNINKFGPNNGGPFVTHPGGPWRTGAQVLFEAHKYLHHDDPELASADYASALTYAQNQGWTAGANTDALHSKLRDEIATFGAWLAGQVGWIGEIGWRRDVDATAWNGAAEAAYDEIDAQGLHATAWQASSWIDSADTANSKLLHYAAVGNSYAQLNTTLPSAAVVEAHL